MNTLRKRQISACTSFDSQTTDTEDFVFSNSTTSNIDKSIIKNCKQSKLKIVFMHKNDLKKMRLNQLSFDYWK